MEPINERIQELIATLGESNNRFAQRIDTSSAVVSHIVTGRNRPNLELIQKILRVLPNLNVNWLVMGEGDMYTQTTLDLTSDPSEAEVDENQVENEALGQSGAQSLPDTNHEEAPPQNFKPQKDLENMPSMMSNLIGSQRMMLKSMEQQMLMQEQFLDWLGKQRNQ